MINLLKNIKINKIDILLITLIILVSGIVRLIFIDKIPTNLTGDESWDLSNVFKIIYNNKISVFSFLGDGSVSAFLFYPVVVLIKIFGIVGSLFFLRLNIIIYSILSLIAFFLILKYETSRLISFLFTLLLSVNFVFLNFSRTAWINMVAVFSGLFLIFFLEKAFKEKNKINYILSGIFAGFSLYGYHYGRILVIFIFLYSILKIFKSGFNSNQVRGFIIFGITAFVIALPLIINIYTNSSISILRRPQATFAFSRDKTINSSKDTGAIFLHQLTFTIRGFIFLDNAVMSEGIENQRYTPLNSAPVNNVIKILFVIGLFHFILKKKNSIWWAIFISILLTQFITDSPPNFSRGLFYIPFIYFVCGLIFYKILINLNTLPFIKTYQNFKYIIVLSFFIIIFLYDLLSYFDWMNKPYAYNARQPGIDYKELSAWQEYQILVIKSGGYPIVNQEWYEIRKNIIKN